MDKGFPENDLIVAEQNRPDVACPARSCMRG
jgi:hypothetical protein